MNEALVTCICPTSPARREWLQQALVSFDAQAWPNKEMVIVDESLPLDTFQPFAWVRVIHAGPTIGEKRNAACAAARGEFIAHFDDDDESGADRLPNQVALLRTTGRAVTGFHSMIFREYSRASVKTGRAWLNRNHPSFAFGASLCYRRDWWAMHPFPALQLGEDAHFVAAAAREKQLVTDHARLTMFASIHPGNTSPRTIGEGWTEVRS